MPIGSSLSITLPTQGGNSGTWGTDLNTELNKIIAAVEANVPVTAIDFSGTVAVDDNDITEIQSLNFYSGGHTTSTARSLYMNTSGELVFIDSAGNSVQLTSSGALNFGSVGGVGDSGGTYGTSGVEFDWNGTQYDFHNGAGTYAPARLGSLLFHNSSYFVTVQPPTLSASYSITLPTAAPASTLPVVMSSSGVLSTSSDVFHGTRELIILPDNSWINPDGYTLVYTKAATGGFTTAPYWIRSSSSAATYIVYAPIHGVPVGSRIVGLEADIRHSGTASSDAILKLYNGTVQVGSTDTYTGTGSPATPTLDIGATTHTVADSDTLFASIALVNNLAVSGEVRVYRFRVQFDKVA